MKKITRFVIWICSKFTRKEIEQIIQGLIEVLANRDPEVKPKDDFKEKHPIRVIRYYGVLATRIKPLFKRILGKLLKVKQNSIVKARLFSIVKKQKNISLYLLPS